MGSEAKVNLEISKETAVWLRNLLLTMRVDGPAVEVRRLLANADEVLAQLPANREDDER